METLKKVTELKAELDAMRPLDADRKAAIMQKLRLDWNFHSNHLEGNSLNYGETRALILFGITAAGKPLKDHFEMTGHDEAIKWVEDVVKERRPLTENFIRSLHKLILKEPYESPTVTPEGIPAKKIIKVGEYKSSSNHVLTPTGEIFRFATPEETPAKMHDLIEWYREKEKGEETHPLLLAAEFHYKFIRIHPFDDGNGRTARILMNFILMKYGYPPVIVRTEEKEDKYFPALRQADAGSITPFIEYLGNNLAHSLDVMIRGAKGENIDEADDVDKEIALIEQKLDEIKNNSSEPLIKSKDTFFLFYDNVIIGLIEEFIQQNKKFKNLYTYSKLSSKIDNEKYYEENLEMKKFSVFLRAKLFHAETVPKSIILQFDFISFKNVAVGDFDYSFNIYFTFGIQQVTISSFTPHRSFSYGYDAIVPKEVIRGLIRLGTRAHSEHIERKINMVRKK